MPSGLQGCYQAGGVLGFGHEIVRHLSYPNTLAIAIGNEFEMQMFPFLPVLKAYARDLKAYMRMCNEDEHSPAKGRMRQIPLMYASADVPFVWDVADYLFCDGPHVSIDIFGLNFERWCEDESGKVEQDNLDKLVIGKQLPGAFLLS